jgi:uncharacterized membrane protein YkoI
MKKWIMNTIYILAGIGVGLTVVPALANTPLFSPAVTIDIISEAEAIDIAQNYTDEIFELVSIKLDDDDDDIEYEIVLENDLKKVEVEIDAVTGDVKDWDIDWKRSNLPTSVISMEEAKAIALAYAGEGYVVLSIELDDDDDDMEYELVLVSDSFKIEVEMDARDGTITKWKAEGLDSDLNTAVLTIEEIKLLALEKAGPAFTVVSVELDDDDDELYYEVKLVSVDSYIEAEFDAVTGELLEWEVELMDSDNSSQTSLNDSDSQSSDSSSSSNVNVAAVITRDEAIAIARTRIGEAPMLIKISLDYDDGRPEYKLEFKSEDIEYEFEIDAITGNITEFEIED